MVHGGGVASRLVDGGREVTKNREIIKRRSLLASPVQPSPVLHKGGGGGGGIGIPSLSGFASPRPMPYAYVLPYLRGGRWWGAVLRWGQGPTAIPRALWCIGLEWPIARWALCDPDYSGHPCGQGSSHALKTITSVTWPALSTLALSMGALYTACSTSTSSSEHCPRPLAGPNSLIAPPPPPPLYSRFARRSENEREIERERKRKKMSVFLSLLQ
ncbi:hypothetical protein MPTK1_7g09480 [Marchantia polymorpha subsp. ruderalis]|uniref:Uncharacterized protein n=2 Tax=Marchantia polymorpha TaxID=3197 RepID=A0AAF6BXS7_MARPO|nr:hypothetical protein MARPO_0068s0101 [Marchantia polymorpha]BBN16811.1 hypothetical protein Mp_7g09480 [Marchantia polymorpha subsp. ruderalis]|eukprot:PTQ35894.1 hypothetical protein MARPO_0068s0101 [Marchantia polymorpha]